MLHTAALIKVTCPVAETIETKNWLFQTEGWFTRTRSDLCYKICSYYYTETRDMSFESLNLKGVMYN